MAYAELHAHSNFSFLDGASHPEELAAEAVRLGLSAVALTDHNGLYGAVRFAGAARNLTGSLPSLGAAPFDFLDWCCIVPSPACRVHAFARLRTFEKPALRRSACTLRAGSDCFYQLVTHRRQLRSRDALRRNLCERHEHKGALQHAWMGNGQRLAADAGVAVE